MAGLGRAGDVVGLRIVEAERQVIAAGLVAAVDAEAALGRAAIALAGLVALGREAKRDAPAADRLAVLDQGQGAGGFLDQDQVDRAGKGGFRRSVGRPVGWRRADSQKGRCADQGQQAKGREQAGDAAHCPVLAGLLQVGEGFLQPLDGVAHL
jgi:hypothetical protein